LNGSPKEVMKCPFGQILKLVTHLLTYLFMALGWQTETTAMTDSRCTEGLHSIAETAHLSVQRTYTKHMMLIDGMEERKER
jgi:hypothetical protein